MADQHDGALELVEGNAERLAGREVEVVGRFVEQQQVGALPDDHAQHQPRLFAAAHGPHRLLDHVAAEIEGAEEGAQILLAPGHLAAAAGCNGFLGQPDHVLQRRIARAQHVEFLLREVADVQPLAFGDFAADRRQRAGDGLHQRRLALAVGTEDADALAGLHRAVDVAHDHGGAGTIRRFFRWRVTDGGIDHRQHRVGQVDGLLELEAELGIGQYRRDLLHALQRLDPALRLLGLAGLGLEAVDEGLQVGDLVCLFGHGRLLQQHLLGAHVFKGAVVAAVADHLGVVDVQRHLRNGVEEFAVVADHDQRAGIALEPGFKPDQRIEVEVVGGFVEQQQVGGAHQRPRQLQAHTPAAGETVHRLAQFGDLEAETEDQRLGARFSIVGTGVVQGHVGVRHAHAVITGFGFIDLGLRGQQRGVALDDELGRTLLGFRHILRHLRHAPLRRDRVVAAIFMQRAVEQCEERGFAGAVAANEADFFTGVEGHGGVVEQHLGATAQYNILEGNHGRNFAESRA